MVRSERGTSLYIRRVAAVREQPAGTVGSANRTSARRFWLPLLDCT